MKIVLSLDHPNVIPSKPMSLSFILSSLKHKQIQFLLFHPLCLSAEIHTTRTFMHLKVKICMNQAIHVFLRVRTITLCLHPPYPLVIRLMAQLD